MLFKKSFPTRLSIYVVIAVAILFELAVIITGSFSNKKIKEGITNLGDSTLEAQIKDIEKILVEVEVGAEKVSWLIDEHKDDPDYLYALTSRIVESNPIVLGATVAFEKNHFPQQGVFFAPLSCKKQDGTIVTYQRGSRNNDYTMQDWYQLPLVLNESTWVEPYFEYDRGDRGLEEFFTSYVVPLVDENGHKYAVLGIDVSIDNLTDKLRTLESIEASYSILLGRSGKFISYPDVSLTKGFTIFDLANALDSKEIRDLGKNMIVGKRGNDSYVNANEDKAFVAYGPLSNGWSVAMVCPYNEVYQEIAIVNMVFLLIAIIGLLCLYIIIRRLVIKTTKPITEFANAALSIGKGDFNTVIPEVKTEDELKRLRDSLEYMVKSIRNYIKELKKSTAANERYESELSIASNIQQQMLAKSFPVDENLDLFATLAPAKEVGGDLYDFFIRDNKLFVAIGDVSGKGVPAALYMTITRSAFRFLAGTGLSCDKVVSNINKAFCDGNDSLMFVTMFVAKIDLDTYKMEFCNAGHNPVIVMDAEGTPSFLSEKPNVPVGVVEDFSFAKESVDLEKGSRVVLYTDGVTEAENGEKEQYGDNRLLEFIGKLPADTTSKELVSKLLSSIRRFAKGVEQNDDITVMSIKL